MEKIQSPEYLKETINELQTKLYQLEASLKMGSVRFIRFHLNYWNGQHNYSTWKILVDDTLKTKIVILDKRGYAIHNQAACQIVTAPAIVKQMYLSSNHVMAKDLLDSFAEIQCPNPLSYREMSDLKTTKDFKESLKKYLDEA